MKTYWVQATNLPVDISRELVYELFTPFGRITKIYIHPENKFCSVYFETKESADAALSLDKQPPYRLSLVVHTGTATHKNRISGNIPSNLSTTSDNTSNMDFEDDIYGDSGPDLYNIHGVRIPTLITDDNKVYVPLSAVEKIGFALFEENVIPKIDLTQQMITEFEAYMNMKARNYMHKMRCTIPEKKVDDIKTRVINKYTNNSTSPLVRFQNPARSIQNDSPQNENGNFEHTQRNSRNTQQRPLRKPGSSTPNNDYRSTNNDYRSANNEYRSANNEYRSANNDYRSSNTDYRSSPNTQNARSSTETKRSFNNRSKSAGRTNLSQNVEKDFPSGTNFSPNVEKENVPARTNFSQNVRSKTSFSQNVAKENVPTRTNYTQAVETDNVAVKPPLTPRKLITSLNFINLPLNETVKVVVTYVASPTKCWVYLDSCKTKIEEILFDINKEVVKNAAIKPVVGQIYACTFCGAWYRALVVQVTPSIKVHFLDFGNTNDEIVKEVRELPNSIASEVVYAVCVNFVNPPTTKLEEFAELNITALIKNSDNSYQVKEFTEKKEHSKQLIDLNVVPAGRIITQNNTEKQPSRSSSSRSNISNKTDRSVEIIEKSLPKLTLKEKIAKMSSTEKLTLNPQRKPIVDLLETDEGFLQFIQKIDDTTCLCAIMSMNFMDELSALEDIQIESSSNYEGKIGDTVCVMKEDDKLARGTIIDIKNNQYIVALVDYGNIVTTDKVTKLQTKYMDIPEFTCICTATSECTEFIANTKDDMAFTSKEKNMVNVSFNDVFYNVKCKRWNPFERYITEDKPSAPSVFTTPPAIKQLKNDERVLPVILTDGKILVRNKEANTVFQKILKEISQYNATPLIHKLVEKQLVLCPHESITGLCRGVVQSFNNHTAEVEYIDHGFVDTVPLKDIKNISEMLAKEDCSLIPITLNGFEDGEYTDENIETIGKYCEERKKLLIKKCSDNVYDLITDNTGKTLTDLLKESTGSDNKIKYKDMAKHELKIGTVENVMCVNMETIESIVFMRNDITIQEFYDLNDKVSEYVKHDDKPYSPVLDEVCLAFYEDEWYRARVVKENKAVEQFDVYYIDYGNSGSVTSSKIRKIPEEFTKFPAAALHCCLTEVLTNLNGVTAEVTDLVKDNITIGASYDVTVLSKIDDIYEIKIPSLSKQLLEKLEF